MEKVNYLFTRLMAVILLTGMFTACSDDDAPDYNPPTVSMGSTTTGEIDLSEAQTFDLPVNIVSEAGLTSIVVKDSEGKEWLNQTEFANPNSVTSVKIDLSSCTETTLLLLTVTATAKDGKVGNSQPYSLNVYVPQLYVMLEPVSTISDNATLSFVIGRGVKALANAKVYLNNAVVETIDLANQAKDKKIQENVTLENLNDGSNPVKVEIYEEGTSAASFTKNGEVIKIDTRMAKAFFFYNDESYNNFEVRRSEDGGFIERVIFRRDDVFGDDPYSPPIAAGDKYYWYLTYDKNKKMVTEIMETEGITDMQWWTESEDTTRYFKFSYNDYNELTKVTLNDADYVTDVVYENGEMVSYKIEGKEYKPQYAEAKGIRTRVDCLDADMSGEVFKFTGEEEPNPFYVQGLPAVIPGDIAEYPLQLIYSPYLFNSLGTIWTDGWKNGTDEQYNLPSLYANVTRKSGKACTYKFIFLDE